MKFKPGEIRLLSPVSGRFRAPDSRPRRNVCLRNLRCILTVAFVAICGLQAARAQEERKHKVPGLDRITSGADHQAFSGTVQSLDLRHSILNVNTVQGGNTEVFPIKKGVHVETANGGKLKLDELAPGTSVIIYYEQRGDRRNVKDIVVLQSASGKDKKSPPPS
jgi:hypothetical protein